MKNYLNILKNVNLFNGIQDIELQTLLSCLAVRIARYEKGQTIFFAGDTVQRFGVVLSGQVQIVKNDYYGNRNILANIDSGNLFGESVAYAKNKTVLVSVVAVLESEILFIDSHRLAFPCSNACDFHNKLIENMLNIIAMKNIALTQKMDIISKRTTREKLLAYLSAEAERAGNGSFNIPFNRQELADYLHVERSAMSTELSKLRNDGVLTYHKNWFKLL